jgi:methylamine--corrinoid protein Co-methyltransferase
LKGGNYTLKAIGKCVTVFDVYDRAKSGPIVDEKDWDYKIVPQTAAKLKEKYNIKMDKKTIIPEDKDLINNLFNAGLDMLVECGIYCIDTGRVIKYTRDEVLNAVNSAPDHFIFGEEKEAIYVTPRHSSSPKPPIIQGGPTG